MSISFDFFESIRFEMDADRNHSYVISSLISLLKTKLASIASAMLLDDLWISYLQLVADGKEYSYSGKEVTPEYKEIIATLDRASKAELKIGYGYEWRQSHDFTTVGSEVMEDFFSQLEPEDFKYVDYSWYKLDFSDGEINRGSICKFGFKEGKLFRGEEIEFKEVAELPLNVIWEAPYLTPIINDFYPEEKREKITHVVSQLIEMDYFKKEDPSRSIDNYLSLNGVISLDIKNPYLETPEEVHNFASLSHELYCLVYSEVEKEERSPFCLEFYSKDGGIPRLLSIDVTTEDGYKMYMSSDEKQ